MRISWLTSSQVELVRVALATDGILDRERFAGASRGGFIVPPRPQGVDGETGDAATWARMAEHVARAERITAVLQADDGSLEKAEQQFGGSHIAIEAATLTAAAHFVEASTLAQVVTVLGCPIDEQLFYAPFLEMLSSKAKGQPELLLQVFGDFVAAYRSTASTLREWPDRVAAVRDGLADAYVTAGRLDEGDTMFTERHEEDRGDAAVALTAARAFLAAGATARSVHWLDLAAIRADDLGRAAFAAALRKKQDALRKRLS